MKHFLRAAAAAATLALSVAPASASRVSPMAVDLDPFGRGSVARIQFTNTAERNFPLEIRAFVGEITEDGQLELVPADDDFLIFPPQLVVPALEEQVVRIQYVGEPELDRARVYYVSLSELPIELEAGTPKVQVTVRFNVFVSVEPDGVAAEPVIDTITTATVEDKPGLNVRVLNEGDGMLLAGQKSWTVSGSTKSGEAFVRELSSAEMGIILGAGIVAPGKARIFFVPLDVDVDPESLSIQID